MAGDLGGPGLMDGPGSQARFDRAAGMDRDATGRIHILQGLGDRFYLRRVGPSWQTATTPLPLPAGTSSVAGPIALPGGACVLLASGSTPPSSLLVRVEADGTLTPLVASEGLGLRKGERIQGFAHAASGQTWFTTAVQTPALRPRILRTGPGGSVVTVRDLPADVASASGPLTLDPSGDLWLPRPGGLRWVKADGSTGTRDFTGLPAGLVPAGRLDLDGTGHAWFVALGGRGGGALFRAEPSGAVSWMAGNLRPTPGGFLDGPAATATLGSPESALLKALPGGDLLLLDDGCLRLLRGGALATVAGSQGRHGALDEVPALPPGPGEEAPGRPDLCVDAQGNAFFQEATGTGSRRSWIIRQMSPDGSLGILAGSPGIPGSRDGPLSMALPGHVGRLALDGAGALWFTDTTGSLGLTVLRRIRRGGLETVRALSTGRTGFTSCLPTAFTVDGAGNVVVAWHWTSGSRRGAVLQRIDPRGGTRLLAGSYTQGGLGDGPPGAARFQCVSSLCANAAGILFAIDGPDDIHPGTLIRRVEPSGRVSTLAGGPLPGHRDGQGPLARFLGLRALVCRADGTLLAADGWTVRRISPRGSVTTLAGRFDRRGAGPGPLPGILPEVHSLALAPGGDLLLATSQGIFRLSGF